jgi:hypothetical protein
LAALARLAAICLSEVGTNSDPFASQIACGSE